MEQSFMEQSFAEQSFVEQSMFFRGEISKHCQFKVLSGQIRQYC